LKLEPKTRHLNELLTRGSENIKIQRPQSSTQNTDVMNGVSGVIARRHVIAARHFIAMMCRKHVEALGGIGGRDAPRIR
jgi:hypothetical protein